jgi:hypothetical protein
VVLALGVARLARCAARITLLVARIAEITSLGALVRARAAWPVGVGAIALRAVTVRPVVGRTVTARAARSLTTLVLAVRAALALVRAVAVLAVGGPIGARAGVARVAVATRVGRALVTARLEARAITGSVAPIIPTLITLVRARSASVAASRVSWTTVRTPIRSASIGRRAARAAQTTRPVIRASIVAVERTLLVARAAAVTLLLAFAFGLRLAEGRPAHAPAHWWARRGAVGRRFLEFQGGHRRSGASAVRR